MEDLRGDGSDELHRGGERYIKELTHTPLTENFQTNGN